MNSCTLNNGFLSVFFTLSKGIHQGCPLSALLFILTVEILAIEIRANVNVKGLQVGNQIVKISLLADDTTIFLKDTNSLQTILNILFMFRHSSGLKINPTKTEIMQVGTSHWNIKQFNLKSVKERIYSLGTWFYKDPEQTIVVNLTEKLREFLKVLDKWRFRKLSIYGKIMVLKTFALSKINRFDYERNLKKYFDVLDSIN